MLSLWLAHTNFTQNSKLFAWFTERKNAVKSSIPVNAHLQTREIWRRWFMIWKENDLLTSDAVFVLLGLEVAISHTSNWNVILLVTINLRQFDT